MALDHDTAKSIYNIYIHIKTNIKTNESCLQISNLLLFRAFGNSCFLFRG